MSTSNALQGKVAHGRTNLETGQSGTIRIWHGGMPRVVTHLLVLFLITFTLILYGSLYPWHFHTQVLESSPIWILMYSWPKRLDGLTVKDIVINLALYVPLGFTGYLTFRNQRRRWFTFLIPLLVALLLSSCVEIIQLFDEVRDSSALDLLCNLLGTSVGLSIGYWLRTYIESPGVPVAVLRYPDVILLLISWFLWQIFPLFPIWHISALVDKLQVLIGFQLSIADLLTYFAAWLLLACLLERVLPQQIISLLLFLLLLLMPGKLLLAERSMVWPELIGAPLALLVWSAGLARLRTRIAWMVGITAVTLIVRELWPFRWQIDAVQFVWLPFIDTLAVDTVGAVVILLEKVFLYAAAVWVLWQIRIPPLIATGLCASALAVLEVLQTHLLDRVPEITDPVLAILAGIVLYVFHNADHFLARSPTRCQTRLLIRKP
ncbi:MAG: VanZ family protein [Acidobacteria bacterium]|nr:VanZ family protein [Acidobacteriota bacterium]